MPADRGAVTRQKFVAVATDLIRRNGYTATTVDGICAKAGLTKGAFFHHFKTKDDLVGACLTQWDAGAAAMETGPLQSITDPRKRALGYMDLYIAIFDDPEMVASCLAGTTVHEVADSNAPLRDAANICFVNAIGRFKTLLDDACRSKSGRLPRAQSRGARVETSELATLWMATVQGSLILAKAAQDQRVIHRNLTQVRDYIATRIRSNKPTKKGIKRS